MNRHKQLLDRIRRLRGYVDATKADYDKAYRAWKANPCDETKRAMRSAQSRMLSMRDAWEEARRAYINAIDAEILRRSANLLRAEQQRDRSGGDGVLPFVGRTALGDVPRLAASNWQRERIYSRKRKTVAPGQIRDNSDRERGKARRSKRGGRTAKDRRELLRQQETVFAKAMRDAVNEFLDKRGR